MGMKIKLEMEKKKAIIAKFKAMMESLEKREKTEVERIAKVEREIEAHIRDGRRKLHQKKEKAKQIHINNYLKTLEKRRKQHLDRDMFMRKCNSMRRRYTPRDECIIRIPKKSVKIIGKMRKCIPIWKNDVDSFKPKIKVMNKYAAIIPGGPVHEYIDVRAPIF